MKVCLVGELGVGKTSLVKTFVEGYFHRYYCPTDGANVLNKRFELYDQNNSLCEIDLDIWDISGQEKWSKMRSKYLKSAQGVFVVADLTRIETFEKIESQWYSDIKNYTENGTPIVLICNKVDLKQKVDEFYIENFASRLKFNSVVKMSAKTNQNVNYSFFLLINRCLKLENSLVVKTG